MTLHQETAVTQTAVILPPNSDILVVDCCTSNPNFFRNVGSLSVLSGKDLLRLFPRYVDRVVISFFCTGKIYLSGKC